MKLARLPVLILFVLLSVRTIYAQQELDRSRIKCGTEEAYHAAHESRTKGQPQLFPLPTFLRDSVTSPSGRFVIHYDATSANPDSVPTAEYVQRTALEFDSAYDFEVGQLGYPAPAFTRGSWYDVYLVPRPFGAYGATAPVDGGELAPSASGIPRWRSFLYIDNRFTDAIYATKGYDALRITAFHEFFHLVQFADYGFNSQYSYFQEMSSVWMEMASTPEVKDYLNLVGQYLSHLELAFPNTANGGYGQGIYFSYLASRLGDNVVKEIWQTYADEYSDPFTALNAVLAQHSTSFCEEYKRFGAELYRSGRRYSGRSALPDPTLLPVDSIVMHRLAPGAEGDVRGIGAAMEFFSTGFGSDSCVVVVSRDTARALYVIGTVTITALGAYTANYSDPARFCDTIECVSPSGVYPNPFVTSGSAGEEAIILASTRPQRPVNLTLDVYTVSMKSVYHSERAAEPRNGVWNAVWSGRDDSGRLAPSGEYIYAIDVDGDRRSGKIVLVRK